MSADISKNVSIFNNSFVEDSHVAEGLNSTLVGLADIIDILLNITLLLCEV